MENIKEELKKVIEDVMLPETHDYLNELTKTLEENPQSQDAIEAREDVMAFIEELNLIIDVVDSNKISDEDAQAVYEKITSLIEEHKEEQ